MAVRGSFRELELLRQAVLGLAGPRFAERVGKRFVALARKLVADSFRAERDPYGRPWAALKHRSGMILSLTGRLKRSFNGLPTLTGFRFFSNVAYAAVHQYGGTIAAHTTSLVGGTLWHNPKTGRIVGRNTRLKLVSVSHHGPVTKGETIIPARQMVPEPATGGLGPIWGRAFNAEADALLRDQLGKRPAASTGGDNW